MADHIDPAFAEELDPTVLTVFSNWAELHDRAYELVRWLVNGRSRAPVAYVTETDGAAKAAQRLVMKVLTVHSGSVRDLEYGRHRDALREGGEFARRHLTSYVHEAIPCGDRQWITFQKVATNDLEGSEVLTVLLRQVVGLTEPTETSAARQVTCDPDTFANACRTVVSGVLAEWAGSPFQAGKPKTGCSIPQFFRRHLFDQLEPGGRLHELTQRHQGQRIVPAGENHPLPNPFAVAQGAYFAGSLQVRPIVGKTHGDLHTDNILVPVRSVIDVSAYRLIDTALYETEGPLTRDPAHLVLYIIARTMETFGTLAAQDALIDLLLDPVGGPHHRVPGWLDLLIREVDAAECTWVEPSGLGPVWREQRWLSLAACAMLFLGRTSTRDEDKDWFLRLAARAVHRFVEQAPAERAAAAPARAAPEPVEAREWIGWLCRDLPEVSVAADKAGRADEAARFGDDALSGIDRTDDYREFVRQLGGPDPGNGRLGTAGTDGRFEPEEYLCPIDLCARQERRAPGGPVPVCHLNRAGPRRLRSTLD